MNYLIAIITVVVAYLLGSISFAVIFTQKLNNKDIRDFGSGNAGTTNVLRVFGAKAGALTFAFDIIKGAVACLLGLVVFKYFLPEFNVTYGKFFCAFACMLGHCFPVFFQFRGGKAVATSVGIFAVCCHPAIIIGLVFFGLSLLIVKMVSAASLIATTVVATVTIICAFTGFFPADTSPYIISVLMVACAAIVFFRHSENIVRILNGTEKKFKIKK
ncbi:MAG: glycerol-3-phosphate 1-O-acyltransferase PlsY [Clostridia bacterium]|nr:glycerol-3-phosphate 1-O-acyltransferase PlsY [Clostridia bacterium]